MLDEKSRAKLKLGTQRYIVAAQHLIAEDSQLATAPVRGLSDLARQLQHVSYAGQDCTSATGTQGQDRAFMLSLPFGSLVAIQNSDNANAQAGDHRAATDFDAIETANVERDAQGRHDREPLAKRKPEPIAQAIDPRADTEQEHHKDMRGGEANANAHAQGVNDQIANTDTNVNTNTRRVAQGARSQESRQAKGEGQAQPDRANPNPILSDILKQQDRVLQMSQYATVNQMEAQAVMAQHSARIDQLIAQQRQLRSNWRKLRMEDQNRTQQNMGGN